LLRHGNKRGQLLGRKYLRAIDLQLQLRLRDNLVSAPDGYGARQCAALVCPGPGNLGGHVVLFLVILVRWLQARVTRSRRAKGGVNLQLCDHLLCHFSVPRDQVSDADDHLVRALVVVRCDGGLGRVRCGQRGADSGEGCNEEGDVFFHRLVLNNGSGVESLLTNEFRDGPRVRRRQPQHGRTKYLKRLHNQLARLHGSFRPNLHFSLETGCVALDQTRSRDCGIPRGVLRLACD